MPKIRAGPTGFIAAAEWTQRRLTGFGVPQPASNRLIRAKRLIEDVDARKLVLRPEDDRLLYHVTEAQWTIVEQYIIVRALGQPGRVLSRKTTAKLTRMLSGADTEDEDKNPFARNTQFELYTIATLVMGDVRAGLAEPDLRIDYLDTEVGVAAKRVRSMKQLLRRAKDAVEQIRKSGIPGIVALNVDVLIKKGVSPDVTGGARLHDRLTALSEVDGLLRQHEEVIGSLVFARDSVWDFAVERPSVGIACTYRFTTYPKSPAQKARGEAFWQQVHDRIEERMVQL